MIQVYALNSSIRQTVEALPMSRFTIAYRVVEPLWVSAFESMSWQHGFGEALKTSLCLSRCARGNFCEKKDSCLYNKLFVDVHHGNSVGCHPLPCSCPGALDWRTTYTMHNVS